jgi:hypothetical protein
MQKMTDIELDEKIKKLISVPPDSGGPLDEHLQAQEDLDMQDFVDAMELEKDDPDFTNFENAFWLRISKGITSVDNAKAFIQIIESDWEVPFAQWKVGGDGSVYVFLGVASEEQRENLKQRIGAIVQETCDVEASESVQEWERDRQVKLFGVPAFFRKQEITTFLTPVFGLGAVPPFRWFRMRNVKKQPAPVVLTFTHPWQADTVSDYGFIRDDARMITPIRSNRPYVFGDLESCAWLVDVPPQADYKELDRMFKKVGQVITRWRRPKAHSHKGRVIRVEFLYPIEHFDELVPIERGKHKMTWVPGDSLVCPACGLVPSGHTCADDGIIQDIQGKFVATGRLELTKNANGSISTKVSLGAKASGAIDWVSIIQNRMTPTRGDTHTKRIKQLSPQLPPPNINAPVVKPINDVQVKEQKEQKEEISLSDMIMVLAKRSSQQEKMQEFLADKARANRTENRIILETIRGGFQQMEKWSCGIADMLVRSTNLDFRMGDSSEPKIDPSSNHSANQSSNLMNGNGEKRQGSPLNSEHLKNAQQ